MNRFSWTRFMYYLVSFLIAGAVSGYYAVAAFNRGDWFILVVSALILIGAAIINGFLERSDP